MLSAMGRGTMANRPRSGRAVTSVLGVAMIVVVGVMLQSPQVVSAQRGLLQGEPAGLCLVTSLAGQCSWSHTQGRRTIWAHVKIVAYNWLTHMHSTNLPARGALLRLSIVYFSVP